MPGADPGKIRILLAAPTGKAAYLVRGNTLHSALKIPVSQKLQFKQLDCDTLDTLRTQLQQVKYIFIDEVSMVGCAMATFIHKRLQEISGSAKDFGGYSVIFIGDLYQLKPVCDSYSFLNSDGGYAPLAANLWQDNVHMVELREVMRQDNGGAFAQLLNPMDIQLLLTRMIKPESSLDPNISTLPHLFLQNDRVDAHNDLSYRKAKTHKTEIQAIDTVTESVTSQLKLDILSRVPDNPRKTMQLHSVLQVAEGLKYEIAVNVNTMDGLTNGAACFVRKLQTSPDGKARGIIWVEFTCPDIGKSMRQENRKLYNQKISPKWSPLLPISRKFLVGKNHEVVRVQFPLRSSSAKTVHRSQGDTESQLVVNFSGRSQMHIHYVALSRVKTLEQLHVINFDPKKIHVSNEVKMEMARLRRKSCPSPLTFLFIVSATMKVAFVNAQSLHKHRLDIQHDQNLSAADILFCAETRFKVTDLKQDTEILGFNCF